MATVLKEKQTWFSVPAYQAENPSVWNQVAKILARTCAEYRAEDVRAAVVAGTMELWVAAPEGAVDAVLVTQITRTKDGQAMTVLFVGGAEMRDWIGERWRLADYARRRGCAELRFEGRDGWQRFFPEAEQVGVKLRIKL